VTLKTEDIDNDEIDLLALAGTLWRGKWVIAAITLFFVFMGGYYAFRMAVPLYPATATIALNEGQQQVISDIESIMSGGPVNSSAINTELEVLRSRDLVGQLVDHLDLVSRPEFNGLLREPTLSDDIRAYIMSLIGGANDGETTQPSPEAIRASVVSAVREAISVSNARNTLVINISVTTTDTQLSVAMANALAELYIENQIQVKLDALASATEFLSRRTSELRQSLEELETDLTEFSEQAELVSPAVLEAQSLQLRELRTRLSEARERVVDETATLSSLQALWEVGELEAFVAAADEFRLNRALAQYRDDLISLEELEAEVERFILQHEAQVERDSEQLEALQASEATLAGQIERQSQELIALQQLERETETARLLYETFFTRLQEINVQQGLETADSRLLSEAIPRPPSSPRKSRILALAGILGLMLGAGLVLLREMRFAGFRTADELRNHSERRVLASIPLIPAKERKSVISFLKDKPNSVISEAVRNLRTSILMSNIDHPPQVIMLTSSIPGEGKTTLALALARNMVGLGKRVLLIEADIRRRVYSEYMDTEKTVALLDLLTEKVQPEDVSPYVEDLGFDILTGTKSDVNAADLFASERFSSLLKNLREHYDYILIDTPPVLAVPDARVIGSLSDANIYVVQWNGTTRTQVRQGLEMLGSVSVDITGLVLNKLDARKMKTYGYGGQYGYDTYGSSYYDR
jgi:capsular exopolysaccharide synthesis family protein